MMSFSPDIDDMGKCQNGDCPKPATVVNRANRCVYCIDCDNRIRLAIEAIREDYLANNQIYGNKDGTIDRREYWTGKE